MALGPGTVEDRRGWLATIIEQQIQTSAVGLKLSGKAREDAIEQSVNAIMSESFLDYLVRDPADAYAALTVPCSP